jgi:hypothetical protein
MKALYSFITLLLLFQQSKGQNIGIGTATPHPSAQLDISSTSKGLLIPRMTNTQMNAIASPAAGLMIFNLTDSVFYVRKNSGWTKLIPAAAAGGGWTSLGNDLVNSNTGNVIIGSSNQSVYKLNITGTDLGQTFYGVGDTLYGSFSNSNGHFDIESNYGNSLGGRPAKHILLNPPGSGVFFPGNVGINTDDPSHAKLEINGRIGATVAMFGADRFGVTISADNPEIGFNYFYNNDTKTIRPGYAANIGMSPGNGDIYIGNFSGNQSGINFGSITGYQYCITVKQNGNVGIGTTDPTYKLSVNGNIRSKEVVVESGWADYVFDKDYTLQPLSQTEQYIQRYQHLPGIPSAAEIRSNGLSIGDLQSKMMAKIEELTLHIIALEKKINSLENNSNR